jgi:hypothetical protein
LFALAVALVVPSLSAVIVELREWHGKQIQCVHGGAWLFAPKSCGTQWYARVFTGTVQFVAEISDTDRRLQISPDEVFLGDSAGIVTATVNQACLTPNDPEIKAGDRWLFYLRSPGFTPNDAVAPELVIPFDGPSKPLPQADGDVAKLRQMAKLTDSGILNGNVRTMETMEGVPNHRVVAKRVSDGAQYSTLSDSQGDFEFAPLPTGSYEVAANTVDGLWAGKDRTVEVRSAQCAQTSFMLETDGSISGHIRSGDGKPFIVHPWVQIVSVDDERFTSAYVDANGDFEARGVSPGRYMVGIGIRTGTGGAHVPTPIYFPGVRTQRQATIVELGRAEKRTHIDFQLPIEDVLKPLGQATSKH